jgi:hypothetical protein
MIENFPFIVAPDGWTIHGAFRPVPVDSITVLGSREPPMITTLVDLTEVKRIAAKTGGARSG